MGAGNPAANTIVMTSGGSGLSAGPNLNAATPSPTFYTTISSNYWYYNGATWTNTGHGTGNGAAALLVGVVPTSIILLEHQEMYTDTMV